MPSDRDDASRGAGPSASPVPPSTAPGGEARAPETLSRRPLAADRRLVGTIALVALGLAASYAYFFHFKDGEGRPGPSFVQYALLVGNVLLLVAVVFYLQRYLIRLLSERRAGLVGSRFKLKLVVAFIGLCLAPAMILYAAAILIMNAAIDRALAPDVRQMVLDAKAVERQFYDDALADLASDLHEITTHLAALPELATDPARAAELRAWLAQERLALAQLHPRAGAALGSTPIVAATPSMEGKRSPLEEPYTPRDQLARDVAVALAGSHFERVVPVERRIYLVAGGPVLVPGLEDPIGAALVARRVPADLAERVQRLAEQSREHERLSAGAPWMKAEQALMFLALSVAIILGATWVGLYISRGITAPIQRLAEGTRELRRGNLSHVVDWKGQDELADLVDAFNGMARDLRVKAELVDRKTSELESANLELERVNAEVERRRREVETLLDAMSAGVIAVDASGTVIVANRAVRQILQLGPASRIGQPQAEFLAAPALADLRGEIEQALQRRTARREVSAEVALESGPLSLQVVLTSQAGPDGNLGVLAILEDVTELVRAQKLATWRAAARRIAHEIKNPLTPIQLSAQRILKKFRDGAKDLPEVLESGVETIIAEVSGLKQMVDEFSDFARMPEVRPVPGDVGVMLESVRALYEGHEALAVSVSVPKSIPTLPFDPELLRRAVVNLVDNAVDATRAKGRIEMRAVHDASRGVVSIEVSDDGPGVPTADRDRLFLPYFTTRKEGTGLGLAIVNRIVTDHGGRVRVEDNRPHGSRFVMELPVEGVPTRAGSGPASLRALP